MEYVEEGCPRKFRAVMTATYSLEILSAVSHQLASRATGRRSTHRLVIACFRHPQCQRRLVSSKPLLMGYPGCWACPHSMHTKLATIGLQYALTERISQSPTTGFDRLNSPIVLKCVV